MKGGRILKDKIKISSGFSSMDVAQDFSNTLSIIKSLLKEK